MSATGKREDPVALEPVIARLRQIAAEAGDHLLLADGPSNPDRKLLDLCAEIIEQRKTADAVLQRWKDAHGDGYHPLYAVLHKETGRLRSLLREAGKLHATTGAGIYAKALAVRHSKSAAPLLCFTLAEDLIANPALRALLWGTEPEPVREE